VNRRRGSTLVNTLVTLVVLALLGGGGYAAWFYWLGHASANTFRTAEVEKTDLLADISSTGTIVPEDVIDVGAQVVGMIKGFGPDPRDTGRTVDYGTPVDEGAVLARLDDSVYRSQLESAEANEARAKADLKQMEAKVRQTERDWNRAQNLLPRKIISDLDYDTAQNAYETAKASLEVGKATLKQAEASRRQAEINLGYTVIKSPVRGIIVDRRVNIGQTVVSSLNAPSLFLIAKDLKRLLVYASVNEADIGQVYVGQKVRFFVDAHPGREFKGEVSQIRLNATSTQNVVTYTVVVSTDNSDGVLLPYLTANLKFEVSRRPDVLAVPNAALRFKPTPAQIAPDVRAAAGGGRPKGKEQEAGKEKTGTVWVEDRGFVRPVRVTLGITDGTLTEVKGDGISEGTVVVISASGPETAGGGSANPFMPTMNRRQ
jgi:HlyD family secretion protein